MYALTAGVYLLLILMQKNAVPDISNEILFKILFEFRHPHHFIFSSFSNTKTLVFFILVLISAIFYFKRSTSIFQFFIISLVGILLYIFAVDGLSNVSIGNFQFYKVTQWMKFFGVVASLGFMEKVFSIQKDWDLNFRSAFFILILGMLSCWIVILNFNEHLPYNVPFQIFEMKQKDEMISICEDIRKYTPKESVFIQPFENTELKYYSQRSSFVEFKANVRNKAFVSEWMSRINVIYGLDLRMKQKGFELQTMANQNYNNLSQYMLKDLKHRGVTHMLVKQGRDFSPGIGIKVLENKSYAVYKL
jgi:hypothetical protein